MNEWDPLSKAKESPTFCILPWIHQYVGPPGDIKPCCVYDHKSELGSLRDSTLAEVWNNDTTKQLRLDMLNGVRREECSRCNDREHLQMAFKNGFNENYFTKRPDLNHIVEVGDDTQILIANWDVDPTKFTNFKIDELGNTIPDGDINNTIVLRLYEPLPGNIEVHTPVWVSKLMSLPIVSEVKVSGFAGLKCPELKGPNFNASVDFVKSNSLIVLKF